MLEADTSLLLLPPGHPGTWPTHDHVEIHSENTNTRVISGTQIDVFLDTKTKVASFRKVPSSQLVLLNLQPTLKDLLCLWSTDGNVDGNLFVTTNTKSSDSVTGF